MTINPILSSGHVALVTGAASGIGKAVCRRLAKAGMAVCLVDLPGDDLDEAAAEIKDVASGDESAVFKVPTDLADPDQIAALHETVQARFGKVHLLMNNAVSREGRGHDADLDAWRQAMDVNFWGPITMVRTFLPTMQATGEPGMIVNVGSKQGITNPPGHPIYNIAKSALKTYTETLEHELRASEDGQRITAHLLIPGWTTTGKKAHQDGAWLPDQVVDFMLEALGKGAFYILCPDDEVTTEMDHKRILWTAGDIVESRPPLSRWHPDFKTIANKACS